MELIRKDFAEMRAHTDASLGAERADTDSVRLLAAKRKRHTPDDFMERDRLVADERLRAFRESADRALVGDRPTPPLDHRAALAAQDADRERQESHRHDTDDQLMLERNRADATVVALDQTKLALADAQSEQERQLDVLGMVTHDLRSPLSVIVLSAQTIAEDTADASTRECALEVTCAAARMERLLMDLLDVARIESRTLRITRGLYDVGAFVTEVLRSYQPLFAARGVKFDVDISTPIVASFDHDRIVQVFSNLLGNAMKFTPADGAIGLRVARRDHEVEFVLRDSGPGIHADSLPHVFKRFWQVDQERRRGLGLGLYICKQIVEAHGGRIWVESEFGSGATFRFTLPLSA